jgi:hypothetical protein
MKRVIVEDFGQPTVVVEHYEDENELGPIGYGPPEYVRIHLKGKTPLKLCPTQANLLCRALTAYLEEL